MADIISTLTSFSLEEAYVVLEPLAIFIIGMAIYSIFIFKLYKLAATRDIFEKRERYKKFKEGIKSKTQYTGGKRILLHIVEYIFFYPFIIFFFFAFFFILLVFLSRSTDISSLLLVAMAVGGAIRVTSYYSEDLSKDLAKMLPFALLAIFLVDISFFSFSASFDVLKGAIFNEAIIIPLIYYLSFIILLEFILRILYFIFGSSPEPFEQ